jgi:choline dehydrogenase
MTGIGLDAEVVVVGGGSAGCAAVHRLASAGVRVLLVEAGPDYGRAASGRWPGELLDPRTLPASHDWGLLAQRPDGQAVPARRARVIGGCSAHNQCGAWWGPPADYDRWARLTGDRRWSWRMLRPTIDRIEDAGAGAAAGRGHGGLLPTRAGDQAALTAWQGAFLDAALAAGFAPLDDLSGAASPDGVGPYWVNIAGGVRVNSAFAFLDPVRANPGVRVLDRALAERLVLERGRAVALVCRQDGQPLELTAGAFVLAAGTYGSPAILLRSGIGPAAGVAALGIPVVVDLPGVGANLHDHPGAALGLAPSTAAAARLDGELAAGRSTRARWHCGPGPAGCICSPTSGSARTDPGRWSCTRSCWRRARAAGCGWPHPTRRCRPASTSACWPMRAAGTWRRCAAGCGWPSGWPASRRWPPCATSRRRQGRCQTPGCARTWSATTTR